MPESPVSIEEQLREYNELVMRLGHACKEFRKTIHLFPEITDNSAQRFHNAVIVWLAAFECMEYAIERADTAVIVPANGDKLRHFIVRAGLDRPEPFQLGDLYAPTAHDLLVCVAGRYAQLWSDFDPYDDKDRPLKGERLAIEVARFKAIMAGEPELELNRWLAYMRLEIERAVDIARDADRHATPGTPTRTIVESVSPTPLPDGRSYYEFNLEQSNKTSVSRKQNAKSDAELEAQATNYLADLSDGRIATVKEIARFLEVSVGRAHRLDVVQKYVEDTGRKRRPRQVRAISLDRGGLTERLTDDRQSSSVGRSRSGLTMAKDRY